MEGKRNKTKTTNKVIGGGIDIDRLIQRLQLMKIFLQYRGKNNGINCTMSH